MIKIIVKLLSSFLGGQLKIVADNKNIHVSCPLDNQHFKPYFHPCQTANVYSCNISWFTELSDLIKAIVFSSLNNTGLGMNFKMLVVQWANNMNILIVRHNIKLSVQKL